MLPSRAQSSSVYRLKRGSTPCVSLVVCLKGVTILGDNGVKETNCRSLDFLLYARDREDRELERIRVGGGWFCLFDAAERGGILHLRNRRQATIKRRQMRRLSTNYKLSGLPDYLEGAEVPSGVKLQMILMLWWNELALQSRSPRHFCLHGRPAWRGVCKHE